jgi:hypothetical protein
MGFSKSEFRPIELFQYMGGGVFSWDNAEAAKGRHSVLEHRSRTHANLGAPFKRIYVVLAIF